MICRGRRCDDIDEAFRRNGRGREKRTPPAAERTPRSHFAGGSRSGRFDSNQSFTPTLFNCSSHWKRGAAEALVVRKMSRFALTRKEKYLIAEFRPSRFLSPGRVVCLRLQHPFPFLSNRPQQWLEFGRGRRTRRHASRQRVAVHRVICARHSVALVWRVRKTAIRTAASPAAPGATAAAAESAAAATAAHAAPAAASVRQVLVAAAAESSAVERTPGADRHWQGSSCSISGGCYREHQSTRSLHSALHDYHRAIPSRISGGHHWRTWHTATGRTFG